MAIVLVTVFVFGCSSDLALSWLNIETGVDEQEFRDATCKTTKYPFLRRLDQEYICPFFIRDYQNSTDKQNEDRRDEEATEEKEKLLHEVLSSSLKKLYKENEVEMILEDIARNPHYRMKPRPAARVTSFDDIELLYNDGRREGCDDCAVSDHHNHSDYQNHGDKDVEMNTRCSFVVA